MASPATNFDITSNGDIFSSDPFANVFNDVGSINLGGQMDGMPGGGASNGSWYTADPAGVNIIYNDPSVNPNQTGGWQSIAQSILQLGSQAFLTFERGTPSVATPPPRPIQTGGQAYVPPTVGGASSGTLFGFPLQTMLLIAVAVGGLIWVAKTI